MHSAAWSPQCHHEHDGHHHHHDLSLRQHDHRLHAAAFSTSATLLSQPSSSSSSLRLIAKCSAALAPVSVPRLQLRKQPACAHQHDHQQLKCPSIMRARRSAVLWLRANGLRLRDNCAVVEALRSKRAILPLLTISQSEWHCLSTRDAIRDIARRLHLLHSALYIRVLSVTSISSSIREEQQQEELLHFNFVSNFANRLGATTVFTLQQCQHPPLPHFNCYHSTSRPVFVQLPDHFLSDDTPITTWPPLPSACVHKQPLHGAFVMTEYSRGGETLARESLVKILRHPVPFRHVLQQFLRLGCISSARVDYEARKLLYQGEEHPAAFHNSAPPTPSSHSRSTHTHIGEKVLLLEASAPAAVASAAAAVAAYDVSGGDRRGVKWDNETQAFVLQEWEHTETERRMKPKERLREFIRRRRMFLKTAFFPDDVTPDYYSFTAWRFAQRCVSATVGVFGTQALLLALGVRSGRIGQAAAISWVLKDGLGRVGKMIWASGMGKDFDVDPKRWRFRSALVYAFGNGLEIVTQLFPASFLLFATAANSMKQVSMLTSSATRNAMYRSFGGGAQNIANITAKGEAQIVIADLIGMICGIRLSRVVGTKKSSVLAAYTLLTMLDIFGIYMELRQVVFRTLNAERTNVIVEHYLKKGEILSPQVVSSQERIFLRPRYESRTRFSSIAKAARDPVELDALLNIFRREHYLVSMPGKGDAGPCRVVLRRDASNPDVLRALFTVGYVHKHVQECGTHKFSSEQQSNILQNARRSANRYFPTFVKDLHKAGWNTDNLLFGTLKRRGYWRREKP